MESIRSGPGAPDAHSGPRPGAERPLHVAVVHAAGDICHITADVSRDGLARRLGDYVRRQAPIQLWPQDAERVAELLGEGRADEAVDLYFSRTGERWGREELVRESLPLPSVDFPARRSTDG